MHQKERVIAPLLIDAFNMDPFVVPINTDTLGTFSGERVRMLSPYETARQKCYWAMAVSGSDMAIASEGSFGPHPTIGFVPANEELVLLVDQKNNCEFYGKTLTTDTNFSGGLVYSRAEAKALLQAMGFPEHGLIVKDSEHGFRQIHKGIQSLEEFESILDTMLETQGRLWIETDMRAMYNPTRMQAIQKATENVIKKMKSECPQCKYPGFWIVEAIKGLKCAWCHGPTQSVQAYRYKCKHCQFEMRKDHLEGKKFENPMYCNACNP